MTREEKDVIRELLRQVVARDTDLTGLGAIMVAERGVNLLISKGAFVQDGRVFMRRSPA